MSMFSIKRKITGEVMLSIELSAEWDDKSYALQLGFAVKSAIEAKSDLRYADLSSAENSEMAVAITRILPEGDLIGWKKCRHGVIVKLRIPEAAKRCHAFGRKCRAEFADVLEIFGGDHGIPMHDGVTKYNTGARIMPDAFDTDFTKECSNGVHFYITRLEAEAHA